MSTQTSKSDITALGATEIARLVRKKELTPEAVVQAHLDRIQNLDPTIGAFQLVRTKRALDEARQLGKRTDLAKLPLAGVPVAIKDDANVAGEPTRYGSAATSTKMAEHDDELVHRLREAGCIIIGKTKMPELAIWPFTESPTFGETHNPWNTNRTAGGSSGGSAAAVAAHMVPIALASDGGGSIRVPSACCGIVGLKPGPNVIPTAGTSKRWMGMTEFGPLARTAEDLAAMFNVLRDTPGKSQSTKQLNIVFSTKTLTPSARLDPQVKQAMQQLTKKLAAAGHNPTLADPPYPTNLAWRFGSRWLAGITEDAKDLPIDKLERRTQAMVRAGKWITKHGWQKLASKDNLSAHMQQWFASANYDVLIMPTMTRPAIKNNTWQGKGWIKTTLGVGDWIMTSPWSLARFPAASVPASQSSDGLPIGVQLVTTPGNEDILLELIAQIEQLSPWPTKIPGL